MKNPIKNQPKIEKNAVEISIFTQLADKNPSKFQNTGHSLDNSELKSNIFVTNNTKKIKRSHFAAPWGHVEIGTALPDKSIRSNPKAYFEKANITKTRILDYLIYYTWYHGKAFPSQAHIAQQIGTTERNVNRIIKQLKEEGLIEVLYRRGSTWDHCIYRVTPWLFKPYVRKQINHLLTSLCYFALSFLMSTEINAVEKVCPSENVVLRYESYLFKNQISVLNTERSRAHAHRPPETDLINNKGDGIVEIKRGTFATDAIYRAAKVLKLTELGQHELLQFPDDVIGAALFQYKSAKSVRDPFAYFVKLCHKCAKENGIVLNYDKYNWVKENTPNELKNGMHVSNNSDGNFAYIPDMASSSQTKSHGIKNNNDFTLSSGIADTSSFSSKNTQLGVSQSQHKASYSHKGNEMRENLAANKPSSLSGPYSYKQDGTMRTREEEILSWRTKIKPEWFRYTSIDSLYKNLHTQNISIAELELPWLTEMAEAAGVPITILSEKKGDKIEVSEKIRKASIW